jgi:hypothetical protein
LLCVFFLSQSLYLCVHNLIRCIQTLLQNQYTSDSDQAVKPKKKKNCKKLTQFNLSLLVCFSHLHAGMLIYTHLKIIKSKLAIYTYLKSLRSKLATYIHLIISHIRISFINLLTHILLIYTHFYVSNKQLYT